LGGTSIVSLRNHTTTPFREPCVESRSTE